MTEVRKSIGERAYDRNANVDHRSLCLASSNGGPQRFRSSIARPSIAGCGAFALMAVVGLLHAELAQASVTVGSFTKTNAVAPTSQTIAH